MTDKNKMHLAMKMHKKKLNISTTLLSHLVTTICGVTLPGIMISAFGSTIYGLCTSIAQFLAYISLLEGRITGVARAELYVPLAKKDYFEVSRVYHAIKHFFSLIGVAFLVYTMIISLVYYDIADVTDVSRNYTFFLVWIISFSTLAQYLFGLSNLTLIYADQKQYVAYLIVTSTTVSNALIVIILVKLGCDILTVKIGSSIVYIAQPIFWGIYVRKNYQLQPVGKNRAGLDQKWTGMGQHIAYYLHKNIDVVLLTLFAELRFVAVYSIYRLIVASMRNIVGSFASGMEAAFGELIAKQEQSALQSLFLKYKYLLSSVSVILFGTTAVLIVPFVRLYTAGVSDADYIQPTFAMLLLFSEAIDCFMQPCWSISVSANKLRETRWGSYGEAVINVVLSLILVQWSPLIGVALATLIATIFKCVFYMVYAAGNILKIRIMELLKNFILTNGLLFLSALGGFVVLAKFSIDNYIEWAIWGICVVTIVSVLTAVVYAVCYPAEQKHVFTSVLRKLKKIK